MNRLFIFVLSLFLSSSVFARPDHSIIRDYSRLILLSTMSYGRSVPVGSGSAIIIAPGYALSAWHIFDKGSERNITIIMRDGSKDIPIEVVAKNETEDVVLFSGKFGCPCAPIASSMPELDTEVFGVGYPLYNINGMQYVTHGHYQGITVEKRAAITAHATRGASGGGAFFKQDGTWKLFGILHGITGTTLGPPQLQMQQEHPWMTHAVPLDVLKALIKGTDAEPIPPATTQVE